MSHRLFLKKILATTFVGSIILGAESASAITVNGPASYPGGDLASDVTLDASTGLIQITGSIINTTNTYSIILQGGAGGAGVAGSNIIATPNVSITASSITVYGGDGGTATGGVGGYVTIPGSITATGSNLSIYGGDGGADIGNYVSIGTVTAVNGVDILIHAGGGGKGAVIAHGGAINISQLNGTTTGSLILAGGGSYNNNPAGPGADLTILSANIVTSGGVQVIGGVGGGGVGAYGGNVNITGSITETTKGLQLTAGNGMVSHGGSINLDAIAVQGGDIAMTAGATTAQAVGGNININTFNFTTTGNINISTVQAGDGADAANGATGTIGAASGYISFADAVTISNADIRITTGGGGSGGVGDNLGNSGGAGGNAGDVTFAGLPTMSNANLIVITGNKGSPGAGAGGGAAGFAGNLNLNSGALFNTAGNYLSLQGDGSVNIQGDLIQAVGGKVLHFVGDSTVNFTSSSPTQNITLSGDITTGSNGTGSFNILSNKSGQGLKLTGNVGASSDRLRGIFVDAATLEFAPSSPSVAIYAPINDLATSGNSVLSLTGNNNVTFYTSIGSTSPIYIVYFGDINTLSDAVSVTARDGLQASIFNLSTTGSLYLSGGSLYLQGGGGFTALNLAANNDPHSVIQLNGPLSALNLDTYTLSASDNATAPNSVPATSSTLIFTGNNVAVNTTFSGNGIGNIVMDGAGSMLDISGATLQISLDSNFTTAAGPVSYRLFNASGGGAINPLSGVGISSFLGASNPHPLLPIAWTYDPTTYTLSGIPAAAPLPPSTPPNAAIIINYLTSTPSGNHIDVLNKIATPDLDTTIARAGSLVVSSLTEDANADTADAHLKAIDNIIPDIELLVEPDILTSGSGTSAGDEILKRGVWANGFVQSVIQRKYSYTSEYKMRSYGGTIGTDTNLSENIIAGLAWTFAHSIVKHQENKSFNKADVKTNILSAYGALVVSNDWLLQADTSIGFGNTHKASLRYNRDIVTIAHGKHKSYYLGAGAKATKRIKFGGDRFALNPTIGLEYNQFNDKAYNEYGGATNWNVASKNSYNLSGVLGAKLTYSHSCGEWLYKPYLSSYAYINIKDKEGATRLSLDSFKTSVALKHDKASKAWYSLGAGSFVYKGDLEIGLLYEAQLDKKYVGHIGTLKVRWEF